MDGTEILFKMKKDGYVPQNNKEKEFVQKLQEEKFAYREKDTSNYKLYDGVCVDEGIEKIVLSSYPQINYLGLFYDRNNFGGVLEIKPKNVHILLNYLAKLEFIDWQKVLGDFKLGEVVKVAIVGYGKNNKNEALEVELPPTIKNIMYKKGKTCFTISMAKNAKERESSDLEFKPIRRSTIDMKLGVNTSQGTFFDKEELDNAKREYVILKTDFYN